MYQEPFKEEYKMSQSVHSAVLVTLFLRTSI